MLANSIENKVEVKEEYGLFLFTLLNSLQLPCKDSP